MSYKDIAELILKKLSPYFSIGKRALNLLTPSMPNDSFEYSFENIFIWAKSRDRDMNRLIDDMISSDQSEINSNSGTHSIAWRFFLSLRVFVNQYINRYLCLFFYFLSLTVYFLKNQIYSLFTVKKSFFTNNNKEIMHPELDPLKKIELWIQSIPQCSKDDQAVLMKDMEELAKIPSSMLWHDQQITWIHKAINQKPDQKRIYHLLELYLTIRPQSRLSPDIAKKFIKSLSKAHVNSAEYEALVHMGVKEKHLDIHFFPKKLQEQISMGRYFIEILEELSPIQDYTNHARTFITLIKNQATLEDMKPGNKNLLLHVIERIFELQSHISSKEHTTAIASLTSLALLISKQPSMTHNYIEEKVSVADFCYITKRIGWNTFREKSQIDETSSILTLSQLSVTPDLSDLMLNLLSKISQEHWETHGECYIYTFKKSHQTDLSSKKELPTILLNNMQCISIAPHH